jgi:hypothetical protein
MLDITFAKKCITGDIGQPYTSDGFRKLFAQGTSGTLCFIIATHQKNQDSNNQKIGVFH